ncbi:unnamed protein product [Closterium sp. NIES-54]
MSCHQRQRQARQPTPVLPPTPPQPLQMSPPLLPPSPPPLVHPHPSPTLSPGEISSSSTPPPRGNFLSGSLPLACQGARHAQAPQHRWSLWEDSPPVGQALRVEQCVGHVGTCLTLLATVIDQFHAYQSQQARPEEGFPAMSQQEQEEAVAAAMEMLRMLPAIGLVPGSPGSALGPGPASLRRLALAGLQAPRDIVPAAASVLRWMDG